MKRLTLIVLAVASLALASSASAQINCHSWACVNRTLNVQQHQINLNTRSINQLVAALTCVKDLPISDYGDTTTGYVYGDANAVSTTSALDVTASGDQVGAWVMLDTCNPTKTAALARPHLAGPSRTLNPMMPLVPFDLWVR